MYDEMSISDLLGVAHQQAHPDDQPSAKHAPLIDELIVRLRRLDDWRTLVSTEINPYLTDDDGGDLVSEHHRIRYMLQRLSRNSLPPAGGEVAGPSEEEWNKFVYSLWDKYDFAGEPFTWSDFCKALNDARSSLTLWGNHSADASKMVSPAPVPTEGEVADLIAWLGDEADQYDCIQQAPETAHRLRCAADLFAQRHPAPAPGGAANPWKDALIDALVCNFLLNKENESDPKKALHDLVSWELELARDPSINPLMRPVPVSERLPGPEDLDGEGTCWAWNRTATTWGLFRLDLTAHSHWLPAHALPLPAAEVQP